MSEKSREKAEAELAEIEEVSRVILPEPVEANAVVPRPPRLARKSARGWTRST